MAWRRSFWGGTSPPHSGGRKLPAAAPWLCLTIGSAAVSNPVVMQCSNCGRVNPASAVYCLDCGHKLRETANIAAPQAGPFTSAPASPAPIAVPPLDHCLRCGVDNPPGVRFCRMCGFEFRLSGESPAAPSSPPLALAPVVAPQVLQTVVPAAANCPRCGTAFDRSMSFCGVCGLAASEVLSLSPAFPAATPSLPPPGAHALIKVAAAALGIEQSGLVESRTDNFGAVAAQAGPQLVTILKDGSEGTIHRIGSPVTDLGRFEGNITLPDDPYLSPRHARIQKRGERHYLRDLGSVNGIFYRIREPVDLAHGDVVLVGQQVLRLELLVDGEVSLGPVINYGVMLFGTPEQPRLARLIQLTSEGIPRDVFHLYRDETVIGRESGDVVFTDDVFLSRRHVSFKLDRAQRRVQVRDLGSSNGTLVLFRGEREIADGDVFRIGHHLFRFDASPRGTIAGPAQGSTVR